MFLLTVCQILLLYLPLTSLPDHEHMEKGAGFCPFLCVSQSNLGPLCCFRVVDPMEFLGLGENFIYLHIDSFPSVSFSWIYLRKWSSTLAMYQPGCWISCNSIWGGCVLKIWIEFDSYQVTPERNVHMRKASFPGVTLDVPSPRAGTSTSWHIGIAFQMLMH